MKLNEREKLEKKKEEKSRKDRKELARLTSVYPIAGMTKDQVVKLISRGQKWYALFFDTKKYDLELLDDEEADFVTDTYWRFQRQYGQSVKELFMNFPEENQRQQEYVKYKRDHAKQVHQMRILQTELEKLKFIEKEFTKLASYIVIYGRTEKELFEQYDLFKRFSELFQPELLKKEKVRKILTILNNTGGIPIEETDQENH